MAPPAPILDRDAPSCAPTPTAEDARPTEPMLAATAVVLTDAAEPTPEPVTAFVLPESHPTLTTTVSDLQIGSAAIETSEEPSVEVSGALSTEPTAIAAPDHQLSEASEPPPEALDFAGFGADAEADEPAPAQGSGGPLEDTTPSRLTDERPAVPEETSIEAPIDPIPTEAVSELRNDASAPEIPREPSTEDVTAVGDLPPTDAPFEIEAAPTLEAATEAAIVAPEDLPSEIGASSFDASIADAGAWAGDSPSAALAAELEEEPATPADAPVAEVETAAGDHDRVPEDATPLMSAEELPSAVEEGSTEAPIVTSMDAPVHEPRLVEPIVESAASVIAQATPALPESAASPEEEPTAYLEPSAFLAHESAAVVEEPTPVASGRVTDAPAPTGAEVAASPADPPSETPTEASAAAEAAPVVVVPPEESAPAPVRPRVDPKKAAREALTSDLAGVIHDVLSTTQFASRAMKPGRYSSVQSTDEPAPGDLAESGELAGEALPHPVAIRARLGRMERAVAFASVGMMIVVGYFAFSLWREEGVVPAQAPVIAAAPASNDWGERARDITREFGAAAIVMPETPSAPPKSGTIKSAEAQQQKSRGAQIAQ